MKTANAKPASGGRGVVHDAPGTWHSQHGQDATVQKLFTDCSGCFFVDCAANEPFFHSPTHVLLNEIMDGAASASRGTINWFAS
jgi:hypothetical protein